MCFLLYEFINLHKNDTSKHLFCLLSVLNDRQYYPVCLSTKSIAINHNEYCIQGCGNLNSSGFFQKGGTQYTTKGCGLVSIGRVPMGQMLSQCTSNCPVPLPLQDITLSSCKVSHFVPAVHYSDAIQPHYIQANQNQSSSLAFHVKKRSVT